MGAYQNPNWRYPVLPRGEAMNSQNRQGTGKPKRKAPKTAFVKGKSGNPGGRPGKTAQELDLIAACKAKTPEALGVIADLMVNGEREQTRLQAALSIIERAYGKPVQPQDVNLIGTIISRIERVIVDPR